MADIAEASLPSVVEALREAGYEPRPAAWISLSFDQSASPLVLPRPRWQRDVDFDLVRLGLLGRDRNPDAVTCPGRAPNAPPTVR